MIANVLEGAPESVTTLADPSGVGIYLQVTAEKPLARWSAPIGRLSGVVRWLSCHRYEPFWMLPRTGKRQSEVPVETQFLLGEKEDGTVVALIPLIDGPLRASLEGGESGLVVVVESGDPATVGDSCVALFLAEGTDPYLLMESCAETLAARYRTGRLRLDKPLPAFTDQFGWCTWDAFYQEVSQEKVREGLSSFQKGGVEPRFLILDDGWQPTTTRATGERRLSGFDAVGDKFPGGLKATVRMAKDEFSIETFLVWHAMGGYWGGVDGDALPGYDVRSIERRSSPGIQSYGSGPDTWWGEVAGVVPPRQIYRFFHDYHRHLRRQGVDGVKVDNQASLESLARDQGGRVAMMRAYREALEGSAGVHFGGNLINCMSNASEMHVHTLGSTLTRTSTDFWPDKPESHGLHLWTNAQVGLWFGQWVHPDWDMFQSGHSAGSFHAAGRALSGGPVYVSDKPGAHDFDLLRKLVLPDGSVLRADGPGVVSRDCLFADPTKESIPLKIINTLGGGAAGVLGVFNARYDESSAAAVTGFYGPGDLRWSRPDGPFAVYSHQSGEVSVMQGDERKEITLGSLDWELFTFVPIEDGVAVLGFTQLFNGAAAVASGWVGDDEVLPLACRCGGRLLIYADRRPAMVNLWNDDELPFSYNAETHTLIIDVPEPDALGTISLSVTFGE
jgi:raffinose synthase